MRPFASIHGGLLSLEQRLYTALRTRADAHSPLPPHQLTGERGEDAAFFHLRSMGYTVVARRWRAQRLRGDLDLVAWDGDTLVVVEVKTRTARDFAPADAEVDAAKQQQLRRMAAAYLAQLPEAHRASVPVRFDIVAVYLYDGNAPTEYEHFRDAFPRVAASRWI